MKKAKRKSRDAGVSLEEVSKQDTSAAMDEIDEFNARREKLMFDDQDEQEQELPSDSEEEILGLDEASSSEEGQNDEDPGTTDWGKRKRAYYQVDTTEIDKDLEVDEEQQAAALEEKEALRIQRKRLQGLREDDFGDSLQDMMQEKTRASQELKEVGPSNQVLRAINDELDNIDFNSNPGVTYETLQTDFSGLSSEEQRIALSRTHPELIGLLDKYTSIVNTLKSEDDPSDLAPVRRDLCTAFAMNISFYLLLKAKGVPIQNHPVLGRLVILEQRLNELAKLQRRLGKSSMQLFENSLEDETPNQPEEPSESGGSESEHAALEWQTRVTKTTKRPTTRVRPAQVEGNAESQHLARSEQINKTIKKQEKRERRAEGDLLQNSRTVKKSGKPVPATSIEELRDNFGDDDDGNDPGLKERSQVLNEFKQMSKKRQQSSSGEQDVPLMQPFFLIQQQQKQKLMELEQKQLAKEKKRPREEPAPVQEVDLLPNPFYDAIATQHTQKVEEKEAKKRRVAKAPEEDLEDEKRAITRQILKNEGLKKYRKKEDRNARVKNRNKYTKAIKKRNKQVEQVKPKTLTYSGEETGIRSRTVKSRKLK
eukprot:c3477_g1_i1.p1 GENE.c3477_g1_i1~~c3477_g1_i1.p1  ORF type:complete len:595 (-),score=169.23 c3477_g1_i1:106-1890(-)